MKFYQTMNNFSVVSYNSVQDIIDNNPKAKEHLYAAPLLNCLSLLPADEQAVTAIASLIKSSALEDCDHDLVSETLGIDMRELEVISCMAQMSKGTGRDIKHVDLHGRRIFCEQGKFSSVYVRDSIADIMGINYKNDNGIIPIRDGIDVIGSYKETFFIDTHQSLESLADIPSRKLRKGTLAYIGGNIMDSYGSESINDDTDTQDNAFELTYVGDFSTAMKFSENCKVAMLDSRSKVNDDDTYYVSYGASYLGLQNSKETPLIILKTEYGLSIQSGAARCSETVEKKNGETRELTNVIWLDDNGMNNCGATDENSVFVRLIDRDTNESTDMILSKGNVYSLENLEPIDASLYKKYTADHDLDCMF